MSVIAPIHASCILSIHLSGDECQEILDKFPSTNIGEKNLSEIMTKLHNHITLTLHQAKFPEKAPGTSNELKYPANFPLT